MLRRQLACGLVFALGITCASCSSSDEAGGNANAEGSAGAAGSPNQDAGTEDGNASEAGEDATLQPVQFTDPSLEQCVRSALEIPEGDLAPDALTALTHLACQDMGIASIDGLERATALVELSLWENAIVDIAPLGGLTELRDLQIGRNQINDVSPLSTLTSLRRLGLSINQVASLQPLAGLTALEWLNLDHNAFGEAELEHLAGLTNLRWLTIEHNGIQSHSALQPILDAGCDLYDHNRSAAMTAAPKPQVPSSPALTVDPTQLRLRVGPSDRISMTYDLAGRPLNVRQVRGSLSRQGDRIVTKFGKEWIEVGQTKGGEPVVCQGAYANVCRVRIGMKWPEAGPRLPGTGAEPVVTVSVELLHPPKMEVRSVEDWAASDEDLVPFALASPNQFDAGSCLFMANTGAMEVLLNQHTPLDQIAYDGDTDLSERFLMSAYETLPTSKIPYFLTDLLYTYDALGGSLLSRDYPFCAGYVVESASGSISPATSTDKDAYLSCSYNWFDMMPDDWQSLLAPTPPVERTPLFVDPKRDDNSRWRVALFDDDAVERIKYELRTKKAPVVVVYNHYLYWHTNVIVGYDDTVATSGCPMVEDSIDYYDEQGASSYATAIRNAMDEKGGCSQNGVFYVRDSIYDGGSDEPDYDYSTDDVSIEKEKYSDRIIKLSYNWAKYLGNHAYTVHRK
jgi:Leucine rich repeat